MLLGNSLNAITLSLNALLTSFVDNHSELELLLSFGATKFEAARRLVREALRTGSMPTLNGMAIIGLISIPGMMTGQILGGSPPMEAAHYQILIMYLVANVVFFSMISNIFVSMNIIFDKHHRLRTAILMDQKKASETLSLRKRCCSALHFLCCGKRSSSSFVDPTERESLLHSSSSAHSATIPFNLSTVKRRAGARGLPDHKFMEVVNLCHYVPLTDDYGSLAEEGKSLSGMTVKKGMRTLFENLNVEFEESSVTLIQGPSGCGKSQFLRMLAHLEEVKSGSIVLAGSSLPDPHYGDDATAWRGDVRYVSQSRLMLPGTPRDFLVRMSALRGATKDASEDEMLESIKTYLGRK
jgi:ABC-type multidrug transport system fused ATPase/permease subunit